MAKWCKLTNESVPEDTRFYEGLDTGTLYWRNPRGGYYVIAGAGSLAGMEGACYTDYFVRQGRGIRMITAGTKLEIKL